jgi:hypothetical protein
MTRQSESTEHVWARPNMSVTFRAEIMPGVPHDERTFLIDVVLNNGRVTLKNFPGEFRESAFEPIRLNRDVPDQNS